MLPVFETPFLTGVRVTNNTGKQTSFFGSMILDNGETSGVIEGNDLKSFMAKFEEADSKLLRWYNEGKIALTAIINTNASPGVDKAPFAFSVAKAIVGAPGVEDCDFNFSAADNDVTQNLNLGNLIPANSFAFVSSVKCTQGYGVSKFMDADSLPDVKHDFDNSVWGTAGQVIKIKTSANEVSAQSVDVVFKFINGSDALDTETITLHASNTTTVVSGLKTCKRIVSIEPAAAISVVSLIVQNTDGDSCVTIPTPSDIVYGELIPAVTASGTGKLVVETSVPITGKIVVEGTNAADAAISEILTFNGDKSHTTTANFKTFTKLSAGDDGVVATSVEYTVSPESGLIPRILTAKVGTTSGGGELIAAAACDAVDEVLSSAVGASPLTAFSSSASPVYFQGDVETGEKWINSGSGKWEVSVVYGKV